MNPNIEWIGILSDADDARADTTIAMIRRETFVRVFPSGRSVLTFGTVTGQDADSDQSAYASGAHTTAPRTA